jgi:hypothetical protein
MAPNKKETIPIKVWIPKKVAEDITALAERIVAHAGGDIEAEKKALAGEMAARGLKMIRGKGKKALKKYTSNGHVPYSAEIRKVDNEHFRNLGKDWGFSKGDVIGVCITEKKDEVLQEMSKVLEEEFDTASSQDLALTGLA